MEIPLALKAPERDRLIYGIPLWYRIAMAAVAALLIGSLAVTGEAPGVIGWIVIALVLAGGLYEERWTFDARETSVVHRAGLVFIAREIRLDIASISAFRLSPFIRGTVPGSSEEKEAKEAALGRVEEPQKKRRSFHKRAYLSIVMEMEDGSSYLVNMAEARKRDALRDASRRIAAHCGKPLTEG